MRQATEYPSRAIIVKPTSIPTGMSEEDKKAEMGLEVIKTLANRGQSPSPNLPPMSPGNATEPVTNDKEVTVIRGTEKTRVLVPQGN